ncbi:hypothetical protein V5N11_008478 [Cardamine amara subsp. amara]|uniref:Endonuclease/exonuclease/phosphatase domain-containing protein n=1 Tax=Cardamine amara subsp. amara TaxID=228776 RepID=A0ABD0ZW64_CARAN
METRVKEIKAGKIASNVFQDWYFMSNYEYNRLGRIWVVWKSTVRVTPFFKSGQMITISILLDGCEEEFFCSFIYASNSVEERKELWGDLKNHQDSPLFRNKPWLIFGDFNEILEVEEHSEPILTMAAYNGMTDFQEVVRYNSLTDMTYHGLLLTWCNKREEGLICKKLDRVLMSDSWTNVYPQSYSVFEAGGCSDHLRCRIQITAEVLKPRRPFKYTNVFTSFPGFLRLMEEFWGNREEFFMSTSAMFRFSKKLKVLKPELRRLSKEKLGDLVKRTNEAYDDLWECQVKTLVSQAPDAMSQEARAFLKWQRLSELEEKFLRQKSKLH